MLFLSEVSENRGVFDPYARFSRVLSPQAPWRRGDLLRSQCSRLGVGEDTAAPIHQRTASRPLAPNGTGGHLRQLPALYGDSSLTPALERLSELGVL